MTVRLHEPALPIDEVLPDLVGALATVKFVRLLT